MTTEAGERLLRTHASCDAGDCTILGDIQHMVPAIEAEARKEGYDAAWAESSIGVEGEIAEAVAAERARIRREVALLRSEDGMLSFGDISDEMFAAVLAIFEEKPMTESAPGLRKRRPYLAAIGMDALVIRADGSSINFGDALYHPENAEEAKAYAALAAPSVPSIDPERLARAMVTVLGDDEVYTRDGSMSVVRAAIPVAAEYDRLGGAK